ncbi:unnamed protein product [Orchesella dallaii]|uniref:Clavaminate synthase-like protein n=1 Tax=Orchesella dallaii TaxID=48710 RepID=A0ABP1PJG3_9HEXA
MGVLTVTPTPEVFSWVPELEDSLKEFDEKRIVELLDSLGNVFVKYNACDDFGLSMTHRHFDMSKAEILVESIKDDKSMSVTIPWSYEGTSAEPVDHALWTSYGMTKRRFIVPQNWCFTKVGELAPFEFLQIDEQLPMPSEEFGRELYAALKALGVERVVGLRRIVNFQGTKSWETTPHGIRANILTFGEQPEHLKNTKMVQVLWYFNSTGKLLRGNIFCAVHCGWRWNDCNHCDTCR